MTKRKLFHGADGENILGIIQGREMFPNFQDEIFFSEYHPESVFMHGGDIRRKASFAILVEVDVPSDIIKVKKATSGVRDTLIFKTNLPLRTKVLELYARRLVDGRATVQKIVGELNIRKFLIK